MENRNFERKNRHPANDGLEIQYPVETVVFKDSDGKWPEWVEDNPGDWAMLFPPDASVISPRMAAALYNELIILIDEFRFSHSQRVESLPFLARAHFRSSTSFANGFVACFERLLLRMKKGLLPTPNCMGEYVALALLIERAAAKADFEDLNEYFDGKLSMLPVTLKDDDYNSLWLYFFPSHEDKIVFFSLFRDESVDRNVKPLHIACSSDPLLYAQDKYAIFQQIYKGEKGSRLVRYSKTWNVHPRRWFVCFSEQSIYNHVL